MKYIKDLKEFDNVADAYLVINCVKGLSTNNMSYLSITLQDCTGQIEGKKWEAKPEDVETFAVGNIVYVQGEVLSYRNALQIKIASGSKMDADIDPKLYTLSAPIPQDKLEQKLLTYINSIKDGDCQAIVKHIVNKYYKDFVEYPAAVRNHHEYTNGLLFHTISMADLCEHVCECYPTLDRDMLLSGVLLHDIGKTIELSGPIIPKYTTEGKLLGHISIMSAIIKETVDELQLTSEVGLLLQHMILSHHGRQDYGSPVLPLTKEAVILNMIDDMDAKMTILDKVLKDVKEGEFSSKVFPLDERCFYKPKSR
ncbi:MAG: HD domain-containing protein [Bacilli bacterium]|nr:HD domain-containing protein [Bacilli bacterium]